MPAMIDACPRYQDWTAPADDAQMLAWPDVPCVLEDARENGRRLRGAHDVLVQNVPLSELRQRQRRFIGHGDESQPLIATGHQTELYHPGVWVKNAMINAVAAKLGGAAYHFAVDTDTPKHLHLRWPGGSRPITDDEALSNAAWSGLLAPPTPAHLNEIERELDTAVSGWSFTPSTGTFFAALRRLALESTNLDAALANCLHSLDWDLGLRHHALLTSPMWLGEPYMVFLHHLLARADAFAGAYNQALHAYRLAHGIRTPARPMPDLRLTVDAIEVPFWCDDLAAGSRTRAGVVGGGDGRWALVAAGGGDRFELDPAANGWDAAQRLALFLRRHSLRFAPRALTLTSFFRLLLADQFVHGIGGARYDQVTDAVIQRHFGLEAPRFAVTTATLYFPSATGQRRVNLRPLLQEGRRIRHGLLSREKMGLVRQIDELPRRSPQRRALFFRMHELLASQVNGAPLRDWEYRLREAERAHAEQRVLFDRELFFALQPTDRLQEMIGRYDAHFRQ